MFFGHQKFTQGPHNSAETFTFMFVLIAKEFAYVTHNVEGGSEVHFIESAGQLGQLMTSTRGGFTLEPSFQIMQDSKIYVAMEFSSHNLEKRQKWPSAGRQIAKNGSNRGSIA